MIVIDTGFDSVKAVALGPQGELAALRDGDWQDNGHEDLSSLGRWAARVWPTLKAEPVLVRDFEGVPFGLAIDPIDGTPLHGNEWHGLVMADERICRPAEETHCGDTSAFAVRPDGRGFLLGCDFAQPKGTTHPNSLVRFERTGGIPSGWRQVAAAYGHGFAYSHLAFFPGGERFAAVEWSKRKDRRSGGYERGLVPTLAVHDAFGLERLSAVRFHGPVNGLAVCDESVLLLTGEKPLKVWSAEFNGRPLEVPLPFITIALAADVNGRCLFTAAGGTVTRWDTTHWTSAETYDWMVGPITCLAVSSDGLTAAAGSSTGKVVVWDTA